MYANVYTQWCRAKLITRRGAQVEAKVENRLILVVAAAAFNVVIFSLY